MAEDVFTSQKHTLSLSIAKLKGGQLLSERTSFVSQCNVYNRIQRFEIAFVDFKSAEKLYLVDSTCHLEPVFETTRRKKTEILNLFSKFHVCPTFFHSFPWFVAVYLLLLRCFTIKNRLLCYPLSWGRIPFQLFILHCLDPSRSTSVRWTVELSQLWCRASIVNIPLLFKHSFVCSFFSHFCFLFCSLFIRNITLFCHPCLLFNSAILLYFPYLWLFSFCIFNASAWCLYSDSFHFEQLNFCFSVLFVGKSNMMKVKYRTRYIRVEMKSK